MSSRPTIKTYECWPKQRPEWGQEIVSTSPGKAKAEYWRDLTESWDYPYTDIRCRCIGLPHTSEDFRRMAEYRDISFAHVGMAVEVGGEPGVIVGHNDSANLDVVFTSGRHEGQTLNCHPHWRVRYFDSDDELIAEYF